MGDVYILGNGIAPSNGHDKTMQLDNSYAAEMAPHFADALDSMGASDELTAITFQHVNDLHIASDMSPMSHLDVALTPGRTRKSHDAIRLAVFSPQQIRRYQSFMLGIFAKQKVTENLTRGVSPVVRLGSESADTEQAACVTARELAFEWIFLELCGDAAGNSEYMDRVFGRYVPDFNGQAHGYQAEQSISRRFVEQYPKAPSVVGGSAEIDHLSMRAGLSLTVLRDSLIRRGIFDTIDQADGVTRAIAKSYPYYEKPSSNAKKMRPQIIKPHSKVDIGLRLEAVKESKTRNGRVVLADVVKLVVGNEPDCK